MAHTAISGKATVIFDGDCSFCQARIAEIKRLDTDNQLDYLPRQAPESEERFPQIKGIPLDDGILCIATDGKVTVAADAIYQIYTRLPSIRWWTWLYNVPVLHQCFHIGYRLVAANRRRLGKVCENGACKLSK